MPTALSEVCNDNLKESLLQAICNELHAAEIVYVSEPHVDECEECESAYSIAADVDMAVVDAAESICGRLAGVVALGELLIAQLCDGGDTVYCRRLKTAVETARRLQTAFCGTKAAAFTVADAARQCR